MVAKSWDELLGGTEALRDPGRLIVAMGDNLGQQFCAILHAAKKLAANIEQSRSHRSLDRFRRAHYGESRGDGAGREAVLHEAYEYGVNQFHLVGLERPGENLGHHHV